MHSDSRKPAEKRFSPSLWSQEFWLRIPDKRAIIVFIKVGVKAMWIIRAGFNQNCEGKNGKNKLTDAIPIRDQQTF